GCRATTVHVGPPADSRMATLCSPCSGSLNRRRAARNRSCQNMRRYSMSPPTSPRSSSNAACSSGLRRSWLFSSSEGDLRGVRGDGGGGSCGHGCAVVGYGGEVQVFYKARAVSRVGGRAAKVRHGVIVFAAVGGHGRVSSKAPNLWTPAVKSCNGVLSPRRS